MRFNRLHQWLDWLETLHPKAIDLGLGRVAAVAAQLACTQFDARVITIAGTNGKGSTVAALKALLGASDPGKPRKPRVGTYTSPHLQRFNERIQIDCQPVSDDSLCTAFERVDQARLALADDAHLAPALTYFEFSTLAALSIFQRAGLDFILLEVGLGGRLDAVNVVDPDLAIITSIALDHEHWLGATRDEIAREKAGILRTKTPAVIGDRDPPDSLFAIVDQLQVPACWALAEPTAVPRYPAGRPMHGFVEAGSRFNWTGVNSHGASLQLRDLPQPLLAAQNWSAALQAAALLDQLPVDQLPVDELPGAEKVAGLMRSTALPGRHSWHDYAGRQWLLDVAHNPAAIQCLAEHLRAVAKDGKVTMVFAALADKPVQAMLALLANCVDQWIFAQLAECPRAMEAAKMRELLHGLEAGQLSATAPVTLAPSVASALDIALASSASDDTLVVCGSFYTVGEALNVMANTA